MNDFTVRFMSFDEGLVEIFITASSEYVDVRHSYFVDDERFTANLQKIYQFSQSLTGEIYVEFGKKEGNYVPTFSMKFCRNNRRGGVIIELDMELEDKADRTHRCIFYIETDLGSLERFSIKLQGMLNNSSLDLVTLNGA